MDTPLTQAQLIEVMDNYVAPIYMLIGTLLAVLTVTGAVLLIYKSSTRKW